MWKRFFVCIRIYPCVFIWGIRREKERYRRFCLRAVSPILYRETMTFFSYLPKDVEVRIGKERCFLTHGHLYGVNFGLERLSEEARDRNCSMAFFGHTHKPCNKVVNGVHCINPGSISFPDRRIEDHAIACCFGSKKEILEWKCIKFRRIK